MPRLSGFFDLRGARGALQGIPPRLQYHGADGSYTHVVGERDPSTNTFVAKHTPVPFGTGIVLDYGAGERGWLSFRPFDDQHLVPLDQKESACPAEGDYTLVVRLPVLVQNFGLAQWTIGGVIAQNAVFAVYMAFQAAREACEGQLPVYRLRPSRQIPIASRNNEMHTAPVFEQIGWMPRNEERFGPRTVAPPLAVLSAAAAAAALPRNAPNPVTAPAATAPWEDPAAAGAAPSNDNDPFRDVLPIAGNAPRPPF
jgi:hypothetical protein